MYSVNNLRKQVKYAEEDSGLTLSLSNFLDYYNLDVHTIYVKNSFSHLLVLAESKYFSVISPTGLRYIKQRTEGNTILLFVRENKKDQVLGTTESYTFLGTVEYVEHSSSKPINITWKLSRPIPAKFYKKSNKLMVV